MQVSGGHLLAAGLDGGNTLQFAKGKLAASPFGVAIKKNGLEAN